MDLATGDIFFLCLCRITFQLLQLDCSAKLTLIMLVLAIVVDGYTSHLYTMRSIPPPIFPSWYDAHIGQKPFRTILDLRSLVLTHSRPFLNV
jgi:hypothetical protein